MDSFLVNGYLWRIKYVPSDSPFLVDRNGVLTVATTDPRELCVYLSNELSSGLKKRVIAHELGHVFCFSYHLLENIHRCCYPWKRIEMEELICNIIADYAEDIYRITYKVMGDEALRRLPFYLERLIA